MLASLPWDDLLEFGDFVNFGLGMVTGNRVWAVSRGNARL